MKTYHTWEKGDEKPETAPEGCEVWSAGRCDKWLPTKSHPRNWYACTYRWPATPQVERPIAFGLLTKVEEKELEKAKKLGNVEYLWMSNGTEAWEPEPVDAALLPGITYRICEPIPTPQPKEVTITVTVNGKVIDVTDITDEIVDTIKEAINE